MPKITVIVNDFPEGAAHAGNKVQGLARTAAICELSGADSVAIRISTETLNPALEKEVRLVKESIEIPLALILPAVETLVEKVTEIKPAMAIFTAAGDASHDLITKVQIADIVVAFCLTPELEKVKLAAKSKADYVVLDATEYCQQSALTSRLAAFDQIAKAAALAERLSMGVIVQGPLKLSLMAPFAQIEPPVEFLLGQKLCLEAMHWGMQKAISRYKEVFRA